ncbi:hypothetical protein NP493_332g01024 [Ridgeia piscesae]|uniref:Uncharacterized protein n=1 Tax=Ridgeia piscesae TaxID=27915 RepID=A0AAD9NVR9_RIDPI|nr:hypothetical protein NP493_332g01024 [Ridgeia piscesae]
MYKWFCVNKLSLNIAKTNYILFGRYTHQQDVAIINNVTIQRVQATTFLGVLINESLNWKNHFNMVKSKLSKVASVIYKVSHCNDHSSMHTWGTLYCSLFLPHLMYCCEIWGNMYVTNIQCIILIHKRVIRLIHGANRWDHTNNLFYKYRILKFNDIVNNNNNIFIWYSATSIIVRGASHHITI